MHAARRRQRRQLLERGDELGTAVRIPGVVERVHADDDVVGAEDFGPAKRQREEHGVPRGDVGRGDVVRIDRPVLGHRRVGRQRRAAERGQIDVELDVARDAEPLRDGASRLQFLRVPLAVADRQRVQAEAVGARNRRRRVGIEPAAEQDNRVGTCDGSDPFTLVTRRACRGSRCTCAAAAARGRASRSASTHSDSVFGSSTPWTGER